MASKRDYYDVLGVGRDASEEDIRRAFRRLARQYHPDVSHEADAETRFKEVNEAYEVLSDAEKRSQYDRFGHDGPQAPGFGAGSTGFGGFPFGGIDDIFETFFGGGTRRPAHGAHLQYNLSLTFEEAVFGCEKTIEIPRLQVCPRCGGRGGEPGTHPARCPACNGSGEVRRVQQSVFGRFVNVSACERCGGQGEIVTTPCQECRGQGRVRSVQRLTVTVPAGVDDGQQLRLGGQGESAPGRGAPGDLYVAFSVAPHPVFKRQGSDILYDLDLNVAQAVLGTEVEVPTVDRQPARLRVPAGTQHGRVLRLRERGVPHLRGGGRGDQLVRVRVAIPQELTEEQRRLFRELARSFGTPLGSDEASAAGARPNGRPDGGAAQPTGRPAAGAAGAQPEGSRSRAEKSAEKSAGGSVGGRAGKSRRKEKGILDKVKDVLGGERDAGEPEPGAPDGGSPAADQK